MRVFEILKEYRRDVTAKNYGAKLIDRLHIDTGSDYAQKSANEIAEIKTLCANDPNIQAYILDQFEQADPTKNKQWTQWIVLRYLNGDYLIEDLPIVKQYLEKFAEAIRLGLLGKQDPTEKDLNRYKKLGDLKQKILAIFKSSDSGTTADNTGYPVLPETKVLYNGPAGQFVIPLTRKASQELQKLGHESEWCTADSRAPTYFSRYSSEGPLYIWIDRSGKKYQFHFPKRQFMDELDNPISDDTRDYFFKEHPITSQVLGPIIYKLTDQDAEKYFSYLPDSFKTEQICEKAVGVNPKLLRYVPKTLDREFLYRLSLKAVKQDGWCIRFVPEELRTAKLCELAFKQSVINSFPGIPDRYKTQKMCIVAVKQNPELLKYVPHNFKTEKLCSYAVKQNATVFNYVPYNLKTDKLCSYAVSEFSRNILFVPDKFKTPELCTMAVSRAPILLGDLDEKFRTPEVCKAAVSEFGMMLEFVPLKLRTPELCRLAILSGVNSYSHQAIKFVPDKLVTPELVELALQVSPWSVGYMPERVLTTDLLARVLNDNYECLSNVPDHLVTMDVVKTAFANKTIKRSSIQRILSSLPKKIRPEAAEFLETRTLRPRTTD